MNDAASSHDGTPVSEIIPVDLKNRWLALFLAWIFPGLGHFYQGRVVKGTIFALCLIPLLIMGLWMGTYREPSSDSTPGTLRFASCVYCDFGQPNGSSGSSVGIFQRLMAGRLYFIPQAANATMAIPALVQSQRFADSQELYWNGAFAPPAKVSGQGRPTLNEILLTIHSWFDLGSIFIAVAGMLNILVMFDAFAGPAWLLPEEEESDR